MKKGKRKYKMDKNKKRVKKKKIKKPLYICSVILMMQSLLQLNPPLHFMVLSMLFLKEKLHLIIMN